MAAKVDEVNITVNVDVGTIVMVAEVLRQERGHNVADLHDAARRIQSAVKSLNDQETERDYV